MADDGLPGQPFTGQLDDPNMPGQPFHGTLDPNMPVDPNTGRPIGPQGHPLEDFEYGLRKPIDTGAVLAARGLAAAVPQTGSGVLPQLAQQNLEATQKATQQAADAYASVYGGHPPASSPQRDLGEMVTTAPLAYSLPYSTGAFWPRLASNAVGGALSSILTGDPNASASELGTEALKGGAWGAAAAPVTGVAARTANPAMSQAGSDTRTLMDIGVRPTPGQLLGGAANRIEQAASSIPIIGDLIKAGRARSVYQFNTGVINDALAPIGEMLEAQPGRDAIAEMRDKIRNAYNQSVPTAGGTTDATWSQDLADIQRRSQGLYGPRRDQFDTLLDQYVTSRIDANGHMFGQSFKDAESDLGNRAASFLKSPDADQRDMGQLLRDTQTALRQWLQRSNPQAAGDIQAANAAYSRMLRVENAAARPGGEDPGVFSPAQYQAAVSKYAPQSQYASGRALGQDLSDAGRAVLGPTVPDSGTPLRHAVQLGIGALAAKELPLNAALGAGAAAAGTGAIYNPISQTAIAHLMASRYPWMSNIAPLLRGTSPVIAAGAGAEQGSLPRGLLGP